MHDSSLFPVVLFIDVLWSITLVENSECVYLSFIPRTIKVLILQKPQKYLGPNVCVPLAGADPGFGKDAWLCHDQHSR